MKKPNIKALAIDHGEKIVFGLFAFISLMVLMVGTTWSRYAKTPDELKRNASNARSKFSSPDNVWPPAEQNQFKIVDYSERSKELFTPLTSLVGGRYDLSTPIFHPLYRKDEPKREPAYEAVQQLIVKTGIAPIGIAIAQPGDDDSDESRPATEEAAVAMREDGGEFAPRPEAATGLGARGPGGIVPGAMIPGAAHRPPSTTGAPPKPGASHGSAMAGLLTNGMPGAGGASGMTQSGPDIKALGVRYVAVRGVFPLRKQIENYKRALHLEEPEAANLVEFIEFTLERQTAGDGDDPWKESEWKPVNLDRAIEILAECSELDPYDPVPARLRDSAITMDLPMRLLFTWGDAATHPKIKDEEMSEEQAALENKLTESLDETLNQASLDAGAKKKRGLASVQRDVKQMANAVRSNPDAMSMMKQSMASMAGPGGAGMPRPPGVGGGNGPMGGHSGPGAGMAGMAGMPGMAGMAGMGARPGNVLDRLVVNSKYLLFRYLDFDVEPGKAYRYRVKLTLANPNFDLSPEDLGSGDVEITKGPERQTPWSNVSNAEVVPKTTNFFLKQVEREPYQEEKVKSNSSKPVAQLSIYDWDMKRGTVATDTLNISTLGGFIGETKKDTLILDLAESVLDKQKSFTFSTLNALIDVESDVEIAVDQHPDLKLASVDKRGMARLRLLPEAVVALESGDIETIDPDSGKAEEQKWLYRTEMERKGFSIGAPTKSASRLDRLAGESEEKSGTKKKGRRKRNPRRQPSGMAGGGAGASAAAMMQMMSRPGAPPTTPAGSSTRTRGSTKPK